LDESYHQAVESSASTVPAESLESEPEPMIAKPETDLPAHEFASSNPIYDSVRIVAPEAPESQDFVATKIPTQGDLSKQNIPVFRPVRPIRHLHDLRPALIRSRISAKPTRMGERPEN
jgi:hypothetical protein